MSDTPRTDAKHVNLVRRSEQFGWVVGTAYVEMQELARTLERELAAVKAERDRMRPVVDCRLCQHFTTMTGGCISAVLCVDARQYKPTTPRRYWKESQK